jgi:hypothetical protein
MHRVAPAEILPGSRNKDEAPGERKGVAGAGSTMAKSNVGAGRSPPCESVPDARYKLIRTRCCPGKRGAKARNTLDRIHVPPGWCPPPITQRSSTSICLMIGLTRAPAKPGPN